MFSLFSKFRYVVDLFFKGRVKFSKEKRNAWFCFFDSH